MVPVSEAASYHITSPATVAPPTPTSTFIFDLSPIRVVSMGGQPWFVAADVCEAIELRDVSDAVSKLDEDERGRASILTPGGVQSLLVVSEGGLYTMVLRCRGATTPGTLPHRFRRWVTGEVLPSVRQTGAYAVTTVPAPVSGTALLEALRDPHAVLALVAHHAQGRVVAEQRAEVAEAVVEAQRPKVEAYDAFLDDQGLCNLRTAARYCEAPSQLFIDWMRDKGYVIRENGDLQPSAAMRRDGYLKLRARPDANGTLRGQAMVTRGGLNWLRQRWAVGPARTLALQAAVVARQAELPGI